MRLIGIHRVLTKRESFGRFVGGPGIVQRPISPHRRVAAAGSPYRLTAQAFVVLAVWKTSLADD